MIPTCDICNMKFASNIFWDWHKVGDDHVVMCRNWEGKPYTPPTKLNVITNIGSTYTEIGHIDRN